MTIQGNVLKDISHYNAQACQFDSLQTDIYLLEILFICNLSLKVFSLPLILYSCNISITHLESILSWHIEYSSSECLLGGIIV